MRVSLTDMKIGQSGVLVDFLGGYHMAKRLEALGLRLCKRIKKVSSMLMRGPIVVEIDGFQVAIGHRMASRIIVDVMQNENTSNGKP